MNAGRILAVMLLAVSAVEAGAQIVFARGSDGAPWMHDGGWTSVGGSLNGGPDAYASSDDVEVVVRGTDNDVRANRRTGGAWGGWRSLGGAVTSDIGVVYTVDGHLRVFARGGDLALWTTSTAPVLPFVFCRTSEDRHAPSRLAECVVPEEIS